VKRLTPRVDTSAFFVDRWEEGPVAVLGPEDLWGEGLEYPRLKVALEVVRKLASVAESDPTTFAPEHLAALRGAREVLEDLLSEEAPPQWWERNRGFVEVEE